MKCPNSFGEGDVGSGRFASRRGGSAGRMREGERLRGGASSGDEAEATSVRERGAAIAIANARACACGDGVRSAVASGCCAAWRDGERHPEETEPEPTDSGGAV